MTRKEQIEFHAGSTRDGLIANYVPTEQALMYENGFIDGANWADKNPNHQQVYTKEELLKLGFGFDLNGNILTPDECYERAKKYHEYHKKRFIDKVCKRIEDIDFEMTYIDGEGFFNKEKFITDLRKAMEE